MLFKPKTKTRQPLRQGQRVSISYYAQSKEQATNSVRQRHQAGQKHIWLMRLRLLPSLLALGVIFGSIVYSTTLTSIPKTLVAGNVSPYRNVQEYQHYMEQLLKRSILAKSKLTINTSKIEQTFTAHFPEIHQAKLTLPVIGRTPKLTLSVFEPVMLFASGQDTLIVDSNGKAVAKAGSLNSTAVANLIKMQDDSGLSVKAGEQALSIQSMDFIKTIRLQLEPKSLVIERLSLPAKTNELHVFIKGVDYYLKFNLVGDPLTQVGSYLAGREALSGNIKQPQEYIDLRVEEKVFYK